MICVSDVFAGRLRASWRREPERRLGDAIARGAKRFVAVAGRQAFAPTPWRNRFNVRA